MILIADSHIENNSKGCDEFFQMLNLISSTDEEVVFLGDIFSLWIALDRYEESCHRDLVDWCIEQKSKRKIMFLEGNHEFFVCQKYSKHFYLCSKSSIEYKNNLFLHGDLINQNDNKYLFLRKITKNPLCKAIVNIMPYGNRQVKFLVKKLKKTNLIHKKHLPIKHINNMLILNRSRKIKNILTGHFHSCHFQTLDDKINFYAIDPWQENKKIAYFNVSTNKLSCFHWQDLKKNL